MTHGQYHTPKGSKKVEVKEKSKKNIWLGWKKTIRKTLKTVMYLQLERKPKRKIDEA